MQIHWKKAGSINDIPERGARRLSIHYDGRPLAIFRTGGNEYFALIDECPHKKGPLSEGIVSGETVTCPLHNWIIGLRDGIAAAPDEGCVETLPIRVIDGEIHIGIPSAKVAAA